jgi:hypothetical protein
VLRSEQRDTAAARRFFAQAVAIAGGAPAPVPGALGGRHGRAGRRLTVARPRFTPSSIPVDRARRPTSDASHPVLAGLLTGAALSLIVDEELAPLLGFSAPNRAYPLVTHLGVAATAKGRSWLGRMSHCGY